jgi:Leucine-rich repeat (LRR) protein
MYLKSDGKIIKINGAVMKFTYGSLFLTVVGTHFPEGVSTHASLYHFHSSTPNSLTINFGDGNTSVYPFVLDAGIYKLYIREDDAINAYTVGKHTYSDGNSGERIISLKFENPTGLFYFYTYRSFIYNDFPKEIERLTNLETLNLDYTNHLASFPTSFANLPNLKYLTLRQIGPALGNKIPDPFFSIPLVEFSVRASVNLSDVNTSNFNKIGAFSQTLKLLNVAQCQIAELPNEITELVNLETLYIGGNNFSTPPALLNQITSLKKLFFADALREKLTSWGDLSNLVNMEGLFFYYEQAVPTTCPPYLRLMPKLTNLDVSRCYETVARMDAFVDNLYAEVIKHAPIVGTSADVLRGITVSNVTSTGNPNPTGIYQQPAGYVQGSNNGTPANPMEKVWVLVNQYGFTWLFEYAL